jgi:hypothetical protein
MNNEMYEIRFEIFKHNVINKDNKYYIKWDSLKDVRCIEQNTTVQFNTQTFNEAINKIFELNILNPEMISNFKVTRIN